MKTEIDKTTQLSNYQKLLSRMLNNGIVILDGGIGTELERRGVTMNNDAWCGAAAENHTDILQSVHIDYINSGAEVITANTYASSRLMLENAGLGSKVEEINFNAVNAAIRARKQSGKTGFVVAGSLSHMVPIKTGPDRPSVKKALTRATVFSALKEMAHILRDSGCQLILLEMLYDPQKMELALEAAISTGLPVWAGLSARQSIDRMLLSYEKSNDINFCEIVKIVADKKVDAVGIMHTPSNLISSALDVINQHWGGPSFAYPDSGHFRMPNWIFEDVIKPEELRKYAENWVSQGASAIGGCCGLSPKHIKAIADLKK